MKKMQNRFTKLTTFRNVNRNLDFGEFRCIFVYRKRAARKKAALFVFFDLKKGETLSIAVKTLSITVKNFVLRVFKSRELAKTAPSNCNKTLYFLNLS